MDELVVEEVVERIYFNVLNGEVRKATVEDESVWKTEIPVTQHPDKNCRKCYGRGYIGREVNLNYYLICKCLIKNIDHSVPKKVKV